jgi:hypothetical protein
MHTILMMCLMPRRKWGVSGGETYGLYLGNSEVYLDALLAMDPQSYFGKTDGQIMSSC